MARGIATKWKQIIGAHLTDGKTVTGALLWSFVLQGIISLEKAGYKVVSITSDMAACNLAMWKHIGINAARYSVKKTNIPHPVRGSERLYLFADVPHLLKNLRSLFFKYDIMIPGNIVTEFNLPCNIVSSTYLRRYTEIIPEDKTFILAPHLLQLKNIFSPNSFQKMKVSYATKIFCEETACALEAAHVYGYLPEEVKTTVWFIKQISTWFDIMTSRHVKASLTNKNIQEKCIFLNMIINLMENMTSCDNKWKPSQKGVILSTLNMIELSTYLLKTKTMSFVLTSRFTQDALENTFSKVRFRGNTHPSALQTIRAVRLISIAQFTQEVKTGNYSKDDDDYYVDFLSNNPTRKSEENLESDEEQDIHLNLSEVQLHPLEEDALYHFSGYVINKISARICQSCQQFATESKKEGYASCYTALIDKGSLKNPSTAVQLVAEELEQLCTKRMTTETNLRALTRLATKKICGELLPECDCQFSFKFCKEFLSCRLQFWLKKINAEIEISKAIIYSSNSMHKLSKKQ